VRLYVVDARVAIKWVIAETGTPEALTLRRETRLIAPDLLVAECANILWKKVRRNELSMNEAPLAARLLRQAHIELLPSRALMSVTLSIAIELDHPTYDCLYIALAIANDCRFVTADESFVRNLGQGQRGAFRDRTLSLAQAVVRE
jgi:predicted nucleic acid-binding protein